MTHYQHSPAAVASWVGFEHAVHIRNGEMDEIEFYSKQIYAYVCIVRTLMRDIKSTYQH